MTLSRAKEIVRLIDWESTAPQEPEQRQAIILLTAEYMWRRLSAEEYAALMQQPIDKLPPQWGPL